MRKLPLFSPLAVMVILAVLLSIAGAWGSEIQLAGIRLGQHSLRLLKVYGQPDCVISGVQGAGGIASGVGAAPARAGGGFGGGEGGMGGPGAPAGGEGMGMGMGMAPGGMAEGGMGGGGLAEMMGMGRGGGRETGAQMGAPAGGGAGATQPVRFARHQDVPDWAAPLLPQLTTREHIWAYRKDGCVFGFVIDRDGYVVAISISGKKSDWARTAMWEPSRSVKLGDSFKQVVNRYGYPEHTEHLGGGTGFSRDVRLHYGYGQNVTFRLREMKVFQITIWEIQLRTVAPVRLPSTDSRP